MVMDVDQTSSYMEFSSRMLKPSNLLARCLLKMELTKKILIRLGTATASMVKLENIWKLYIEVYIYIYIYIYIYMLILFCLININCNISL